MNLDWINATELGFVGDGETPNDRAFAAYIEGHDTKPLYFPEGVYCFAEPLNFPDRMYVRMDPTAELKCIAEEPLDYFITLRGQHRESEGQWCKLLKYAHASGIDGGVINCDYKAKCALGLFQGMHTNFENFKIINVLEKGIQTLISRTTDGCYNFRNVYIYNEKAVKGSVGIYDNGWDNHFDRCEVVNFPMAFFTKGGRFHGCSAFNLDMSLIEDSLFAYIEGTQSVWFNPAVDTYRYGFAFSEHASTSIIDMTWITNARFYTPELQEKYPRILFKCRGDVGMTQTTVTGMQLNSYEKFFSFSNVPMPNAIIMNVRAPHADPFAEIPNFRNDTAELLHAVRTLTAKKTDTLTAASDLDTLRIGGSYKCDLRAGNGGKGLPAVGEIGVLKVEVTDELVMQAFVGTQTTLQRVFDGSAWGEWRILAK